LQQEIKILELIDILEQRYGISFRENIWNKKNPHDFHQRLAIIINGRSFRDENFLKRVLKDGDKVWFTHSFFGG